MTTKISEVRAAFEAFDIKSDSDRTNIPISALARLLNAMPVFLEIVEAALALGPELIYLRGPVSERLRDALAKVTR